MTLSDTDLSGPDMFVLTRGAVCLVCDVSMCEVVCVVVVCRTHSQDHGTHTRTDVHVGVTRFAHFLMKKTQCRI